MCCAAVREEGERPEVSGMDLASFFFFDLPFFFPVCGVLGRFFTTSEMDLYPPRAAVNVAAAVVALAM